MYYTIYRTTNKINGKIYVGMHKTTDLDDNYLGSGKVLRYAIEKYGVDNFKKEILYQFNTNEEMIEMETVLVNEEFISRKDTYNLRIGGKGGFTKDEAIDGRKATNKILEDRWGDQWRLELSKLCHKNRTEESYRLAALKSHKTIFERYGHGTFYGKTHTKEAKEKIGKANSIKQTGNKNSQFGTKWINNGIKSKKINLKKEIMPSGWEFGRAKLITEGLYGG